MSDPRLQAFAERIERVLEEARDAGFDAEDVRKAIAERRRLTRVSALQRACKEVGGQVALGLKIGRPQQTISNWVRRGYPPAHHCPAIEKATDGRITRYDLRPDVFDAA